jgi:hypothetical protein
MEGERGLLFEAMVFPLSELTAQAGRKPSLARKTHKKNSKAASNFCKLLVFNNISLTKRTPLR